MVEDVCTYFFYANVLFFGRFHGDVVGDCEQDLLAKAFSMFRGNGQTFQNIRFTILSSAAARERWGGDSVFFPSTPTHQKNDFMTLHLGFSGTRV